MKILITGANGLLGQHLIQHLFHLGHEVIAIGKGASRLPFNESPVFRYQSLDITDPAAISSLFQEINIVDVLVHAAATTQVDDCEMNQDSCFLNNVTGTANILAAAIGRVKYFIYVSTDFVFDGGKGNYKEDDELSPVNWYGHTKMQAEQKVKDGTIPWTIVRTCLVYGNSLSGTRTNIVSWVKDNLEKKQPIKVVNDQLRTPTYVEDLALGIGLVIEKRALGIYHISGKEMMSPYDMALKVVNYFSLDETLITKVDAGSFSQAGKRPPKTGFSIEKARKELGYEPCSFNEGLRKMYPVK